MRRRAASSPGRCRSAVANRSTASGVTSRLLQQHADAVVGRVVVGRGPHHPLELGHRTVQIAGHEQRRAEPVPQPGIVGIQLEPLPELFDRGRPFLPVECRQPAALVGPGRVEQGVERRHQRIRRTDLGVLPPAQMLLGLRVVPQTAVGHPQRIVDRADVGVARQDLLQQIGGPAVVLFQQGRPGQAVPRRQRGRIQRQRLREQRLGIVGPSLLQTDVAEPEQRRRILGLNPEHLLEKHRGLVQRASVAVQLRQIVGPTDVVRGQRRRLAQTRLGFLREPGGHEEHAHPADRLRLQLGGETGARVARRQGGVMLANLRLQRFADPRQVRKRGGAPSRHVRSSQRLGRGRRVSRYRLFGRGASGDQRGKPQRRGESPRGGQPTQSWSASRRHQKLPAPCMSVVHRSISTSSQVSVRPSGHCTSTTGRASDSPRPTITRGSLAEA